MNINIVESGVKHQKTPSYPIMLKRKCNSRKNICYKSCLFNALIIYNIYRFQDCPFHCQRSNLMHLSVYVLIADTMTFLPFVLCLFYVCFIIFIKRNRCLTTLKYIIRNWKML